MSTERLTGVALRIAVVERVLRWEQSSRHISLIGQPGPATIEVPGYLNPAEAWMSAGGWMSADLLPAVESDVGAAWKYVVGAMTKRGYLAMAREMPEGHPFIIEGSRSEYDAPCPDRALPARAAADFTYMPVATTADVHRRITEHNFAAAATVAEAICYAALQAEAMSGRYW
jgi:hypothetical protein